MIQYANTKISVPRDGATQVIREAFERFKDQFDLVILGEGYKEVVRDENMFSEYVEALSEGINPEYKEAFKTLLENARIDLITEASLSGISPVASLQGTMLRKFFPKVVIKDSMPTEVAEKPTFWITHLVPFYVDRNGTRHEMPQFTRDGFANGNLGSTIGLLPVYSKIIALSNLADISLLTGKNSAGSAVTAATYSEDATQSLATLMSAAVAKAGSLDKLDKKVAISKVRFSLMNGFDDADETTRVAANDTLLDVPVNFPVDINGNFYGTVSFTLPANGVDLTTASLGSGIVVTNPVAAATVAAYTDLNGGKQKTATPGAVVSAKVMGHIEFETGIVSVSAIGSLAVGAAFTAYVSSENNNYGGSVEFDIKKREVVIGTGEHINSAIPVEYTKDLMALYSIDGHVKIVDLMSTYLAQRTEYEAWDFFKKSFESNGLSSKYYNTFNCFPAREYAGRPQDWLEELKRVIDYYATKMRSDSSYPGGQFVVMGNPLDINLIKNVNWSYRSTAGSERDGVEVNYSIGSYQGANLFTVISSENIPAGEIKLYFYPSQDDQMTYKYYPYTFNVENGYRDPQKPNVPSIMMTKRHTFEEFTPLQAVIRILNNAGALPERSEA